MPQAVQNSCHLTHVADMPQVLYLKHVVCMPVKVLNKYHFRHARCVPQVVPNRKHLRHVVGMPQVVPNKYQLRHVVSMPQAEPNKYHVRIPNKYHFRHVVSMPQVVPNKYHFRHVVSMHQVVPNVVVVVAYLSAAGLWHMCRQSTCCVFVSGRPAPPGGGACVSCMWYQTSTT